MSLTHLVVETKLQSGLVLVFFPPFSVTQPNMNQVILQCNKLVFKCQPL